MTWIVLSNTGADNFAYGPFGHEDSARRFAAFMNREVGPVTVVRVDSPLKELLSWYAIQSLDQMERTEHWPPRPGDVWQDREGARWCCQQDGTLACLVRKADDSADEIFRRFGPMTLVSRPSPVEEECPF